MLYIVILTTVISVCVFYGGVLGLCIAGIGMTPNMAIAGTSNVMGGIAKNAFRLTKIVDMNFKQEQNNA